MSTITNESTVSMVPHEPPSLRKQLLVAVEASLDAWRLECLHHGNDDEVFQALCSYFACKDEVQDSYVVQEVSDYELEEEMRKRGVNLPEGVDWVYSDEYFKRSCEPDPLWENAQWNKWLLLRGHLVWQMYHADEEWRDHMISR